MVAPGDVIGLVGVNGAGKTTLLRTLAGLLPVEAGTVSLSPPTANVGYLPQERERRPGETVRDFLARRTGVGPAHARDGRRRRGPGRGPRRAPTTRTRPPWSAGSTWAAPTWTSAPGRWPPSWAWRSTWTIR